MSPAESRFVGHNPRLHYLEWNPERSRTLVLMHGNTAIARWWEPVVAALGAEFRVLALDSRGHGQSDWVRPPAYHPQDYAGDLAALLEACAAPAPIVVGHSMGGLCALAFAELFPGRARGLVIVDAALSSSDVRDRFLRRLRSLPVVTYPDLATAKARFRLMPSEGEIAPALLASIAEQSLAPTADGRWTLRFDRESFFGGDGLDALATIARLRVPTLLVRGERSRIMTAAAAAHAVESNPLVELQTIPRAHHHVLLEQPESLAREIAAFASRCLPQ
ncbi:MAG TPA: alpha/beta hydrolase [Candidatus Binataceae bacterium]|nr:alpha/beta hydrolase [Candidatus Binataceae bacterium]